MAKYRLSRKVKRDFVILPKTAEWLERVGNGGDAIDLLVEAFRTGELSSNNTRAWQEKEQLVSNEAYRAMEALKLELEQVRSQLEISKALENKSTELLGKCYSDASKAAAILKAAFPLSPRANGKIAVEVRKALELIGDV